MQNEEAESQRFRFLEHNMEFSPTRAVLDEVGAAGISSSVVRCLVRAAVGGAVTGPQRR